MYDQMLSIVTLSLGLAVPRAWYLLSLLSFGLSIVRAATNGSRLHGGEGRDLQVGNQHGGEIKGDEHPLVR